MSAARRLSVALLVLVVAPAPGADPAPVRPGLIERLGALPVALVAAKKSDADLVEGLYLAALQRLPTATEREGSARLLKAAKNREAAARDIVWVLVNTREFHELIGLKDPLAALDFATRLKKFWPAQ